MVLPLVVVNAAIAWASVSKVTYHVLPISGRTLVGAMASDVNAAITSCAVLPLGMSRAISVVRSLVVVVAPAVSNGFGCSRCSDDESG